MWGWEIKNSITENVESKPTQYQDSLSDISKLPQSEQDRIFNESRLDKLNCTNDSIDQQCELNNQMTLKGLSDYTESSLQLLVWDQAWAKISNITKTGDNLYSFQMKTDENFDIQKINAWYETGADSRFRIEWNYKEGYTGLLDITNLKDINTIYTQDNELWVSLMAMNSLATMWGYIWYTKGDEFEKFAVS